MKQTEVQQADRNAHTHGAFLSMAALTLTILFQPTGVGAAPVEQSETPSTAIVATVNVATPLRQIPADFLGISYEGRVLLPDAEGKRMFNPDNSKLMTMLKTIGIKNLRVGGNSSEHPDVNPTDEDRASMFSFAQALGLKVIFNMRMKTSMGRPPAKADPDNEAGQVVIADRLIHDYGNNVLQALELSNEPDHDSIVEWAAYKNLTDQLIADIAKTPNGSKARYLGPSTTSGPAVNTFPANFAQTYSKDSHFTMVSQHWYPGGGQKGVTDVAKKRAELLSTDTMHARYAEFYNKFVPAVKATGMKYRLEETNSLSNGGRLDVSDTHTSALWALDYMYWWAMHDAEGVNLHSGANVYTAIAQTEKYGQYEARPLAYAMKAFDLGGHGRLLPITLDKNNVDLTAYAVLGEDKSVTVTLINKGFGNGASSAKVTLNTGANAYGKVSVWTLKSPHNSVEAKTGLTLGDAGIQNDGSWSGAPVSILAGTDKAFVIDVAPALVAIVRLAN